MSANNFDYIVIGAGAAGSPVASRLSEDPTTSVAILEAGGENTNDISRILGAFFRVWGTDYDWKYNTTAQKGLNGRSIYHPRGHVVGGSTAINVGVWQRGCQEDYDAWETQGAEGWNFDNALRLFHDIESSTRGSDVYRGRNGMMYMEEAPSASSLSETLLDAYVEADLGKIGDTNGEDPYVISKTEVIYKNNSRLTAADNYLSEEIRKRPNLQVIPNAFVLRILFDGKKAVAVEFEKDGEKQTVQANKEIILSAGAFNTPQLLKLSGVGPKAELEALGIPVVVDVPGVGANLQDHLMVSYSAISAPDVHVSVPGDASDAAIEQWRKTKDGPAIYYTGTNIGFTSVDKKYDGPDFEIMSGYTSGATGEEPEYKGIADAATRSGYSVYAAILQPKSRGTVTLKSSDPHDAPVIDPNYLSDPDDVKRFVEAFRTIQKIAQTDTLSQYTEETSPALNDTDDEIAEYIKNHATTVFHPVGTARIGSFDDPMVVVDSTLRVRGVERLRVADASIMPEPNRGHTMAPTIYIGEMAADIIKSQK